MIAKKRKERKLAKHRLGRKSGTRVELQKGRKAKKKTEEKGVKRREDPQVELE